MSRARPALVVAFVDALVDAFVVARVALVGAFGVVVLASCAGGAVGFCEAKARAECELELSCCTADERVGADNGYTSSEAECFERTSSTCKAFNAAIDDSVALGRTRLKQDNIDACLAALEAAAEVCDRTLAQAAHLACNDVSDGVVDDGEACALSSECRGGGTCDLGSPNVDDELHAPAGECVAPPAEGEECPEGVCAEGLFCNNNDCDPLPAKGDPCNVECAAGLYCSDAFVCEALKVDGVDCLAPDECISGVCLERCGGPEELCEGPRSP